MTETKLTKRDKQAHKRVQMMKKAFERYGNPTPYRREEKWDYENILFRPFRFSRGFTASDMRKWLVKMVEEEFSHSRVDLRRKSIVIKGDELEKLKKQQPTFSKHLIIHYLKKFEKLGYFFSIKEENFSTGKIHTVYYLHWWWWSTKRFWTSYEPFKNSNEWKHKILGIIPQNSFIPENDKIWIQMKQEKHREIIVRSKRDFPHFRDSSNLE